MTKRGPILLATIFVFVTFAFAEDAVSTHSEGVVRGIELYGEGKWSEAILELRRASTEATRPSETAEALYWIALAEISSGEYAAAVQDLEKLLSTDPHGPRSTEAVYQKGRVFFYLGRYDSAIISLKAYSDTVEDDARRSAAMYWIGECLYSLGRLDEARAIFNSILERYPNSAKFEASSYRVALIDQKKVETELLKLLKWSHEESLKTVEEYQRRERSYEQAIVAYQKRIADMLKDTRLADLERKNEELTRKLADSESRVADLTARLDEAEKRTQLAEATPDQKTMIPPVVSTANNSEKIARLLALKASALEIKDSLMSRLGPVENSTEAAK